MPKEIPSIASQKFSENSFIKEVLPELDLKNPKKTAEKTLAMLKELEGCREYYEDLMGDEGEESEELQEAYAAYIAAIEKMLPEDCFLEETSRVSQANLWRGINPYIALSFLTNQDNNLKVKSERHNVAHDWRTSISYGGRPGFPLNIALGFKKPKTLISKKVEARDREKDIFETMEGEINFNDINEIAVRLKGKSPGQVFPPKFYKLVHKETLAA